MILDEVQKQRVSGWIAEGAKLSEIQKQLETEFGLRVTYLDVRLLVDDLKLMPKDPEPAPEPVAAKTPDAGAASPGTAPEELDAELDAPSPGGLGGEVSVTVDAVTRPGSLVSGQVTFSDGQQAGWYMDQMGRLGVAPRQQGYKPSPADIQAFQMQLQLEMQKLGYS